MQLQKPERKTIKTVIPEGFMSVKETATAWRCSTSNVYRLIHANKIEYIEENQIYFINKNLKRW